MPSLVVHVALAGLVGAALLGREFDRRSLVVVLLVPVIPDLDAFAGFVVPGGHRALLHTLLIPLGAAALLRYDTRGREISWLRGRYGPRGVRIAWVAVVVYAFAGIGPDLFTGGGANPFYPLHDQFYEVSGELGYSTTDGWVQTFVDLSPGADSSGGSSDGGCAHANTDGGGTRGRDQSAERSIDLGQRGSTREVHIESGIDPMPGSECENVERRFPVVESGWQLLFVLTSATVLVGRVLGRRNRDDR